MEVKENRPDACAASGTANSIYKDFSTDAPDIQEELTGPVLPDECAVDIVSFCSEQTITELSTSAGIATVSVCSPTLSIMHDPIEVPSLLYKSKRGYAPFAPNAVTKIDAVTTAPAAKDSSCVDSRSCAEFAELEVPIRRTPSASTLIAIELAFQTANSQRSIVYPIPV